MHNFRAQPGAVVRIKRRRRVRRKVPLPQHQTRKNTKQESNNQKGRDSDLVESVPNHDTTSKLSSPIAANFQALGRSVPYSILLWLEEPI